MRICFVHLILVTWNEPRQLFAGFSLKAMIVGLLTKPLPKNM